MSGHISASVWSGWVLSCLLCLSVVMLEQLDNIGCNVTKFACTLSLSDCCMPRSSKQNMGISWCSVTKSVDILKLDRDAFSAVRWLICPIIHPHPSAANFAMSLLDLYLHHRHCICTSRQWYSMNLKTASKN